MAALVALAALPSGEPGTALAYAPASASLIDVASGVSPARNAQSSSLYGVSINDGAASTQTLDVTLTMIPLPGAVRMQVSNSSDLAGGVWEPFATRKAWWLAPPGPSGAPVTVYVQFGNSNGYVSAIYRDAIIVSQKAADQTALAASVTPSATTPSATTPSATTPSATTPSVTTPTGASATVAAVNCSPRPRVVVHTEVAIGIPEEGGAMQVTVSTTGANNGLRAVRFDSFTNAIVHVGSQQHQTAPFSVSIPSGQEPTSLTFTVQRQAHGQATMIRLAVVDGCGEWSTFVGGGPNAF